MEQKYITVCVLVVLFGTPVRGDAESEQNKEWTKDDYLCITKKVAGAVGIGMGAVALAPVAIGAAGFGGAGIVAGSLAAKVMAISAAANGGGVVAGGVVAGLQSAGVAGLSVLTKAVIGTSVGGIFGYFSGGCSDNDDECNKK